jgi:hypothetical protein
MLSIILVALLAALLAVGAGALLAAVAPATPGWLVEIVKFAVGFVAFALLPGLIG